VQRAVARVRSSGWGGWVVLLLLLAGAGGTVYYFATRKTKPAATTKEPPPVVDSVADAEKLAASGKRDAAITGLHELGRRTPGDARIQHLLGRLYADKGWWAESLAAYRQALDKHPAYRTDTALIDGVIGALGDPRQYDVAAATLRAIGKPAIPRLRSAAAKHESASVRAAAGRVLASGHGEPQR
jgi:hypothetical protein